MPFLTEQLRSMDAFIFGGFFGLSLVAVLLNHLARNTDQQRQSVSNANFKTFQRSFFAVYFLALLGDWLQGPYVYKLYDYYGFRESQVNRERFFFCFDAVDVGDLAKKNIHNALTMFFMVHSKAILA